MKANPVCVYIDIDNKYSLNKILSLFIPQWGNLKITLVLRVPVSSLGNGLCAHL